MNTNHATRRTVVITGTSRGIGQHLAARFLAEGFDVLGISRTEPPIREAHFRWLQADLSDPAQVERLAEPLGAQPLAGLINNAGIHGPIGPFERNPFGEWMRAVSVNLLGPARLTQLCIPGLKRAQGFIIFLSGGGSAFPRPNFSAYAVSKTAVVRLSENLARELAPEVLVYCIAPGPNRTALLEEAVRAGTEVKAGEAVGFEEPERLCLFLARNRDPKYSGRFIHVKDNYPDWGGRPLPEEAYTLRRIKP